jgi:hypothetical protein
VLPLPGTRISVFSHFVRFWVPTCFSAVSGAKKLGSASSSMVLYKTFSAMVGKKGNGTSFIPPRRGAGY